MPFHNGTMSGITLDSSCDVSAATGAGGTPADDSITNAKLADMVEGTLKGRAAGAGTGDPTDRTMAQVKADLALVKADVGLANVDNTSDVNKPVSSATQTALDAKQATLVSATNIKTINGASVLGSGDLAVSGNDSRLLVAVGTAGANTSATATPVTTGLAFTLGTGEYVITCVLGCTTAATTTAPRFAFVGSGGLVVAHFDMQADVVTTAIASQPSNSNTLGTYTAATTGMAATRRPVVVSARVRVTTGGTLTLWLATEVNGSLVTMVEGSGFAIKVA